MKNQSDFISDSSEAMNEMQDVIYQVEAFLSENYHLRRNILSGKTELAPVGDEPKWEPLTAELLNSIIRKAKKAGIGGKKSPRQEIEEYICSNDVPAFNPIRDYLESLPEWDGKNHVAELFGRLPGITTEQLSWCSVWLRSVVAHWMGMDPLHGNECVPVLIGPQGCGKSTLGKKMAAESGKKFVDTEIKNGKSQEDRVRYASFLATTNDPHPLCDTTGSRRYLCLKIKKGSLIDNLTPINHAQLYAQVLHELREEKVPYWFSNDEVARIQAANLPFLRTDDMEGILHQCFRLPNGEEEGTWFTCKQVSEALMKVYPSMKRGNATNIRIGQTLKYLGCQMKHTYKGAAYKLVEVAA